jgi:hypothetical protein
MKYIKVENDVITGVWATDSAELPEGAVQVPKVFNGIKGMNVHEFDENWTLRPLSERVGLGYVKLPEGYKLDGENVVEMTDIEKYAAGVLAVPSGYRLVDGKLVEMTQAEKLVAGIITEADVEARARAKRDERLSAVEWRVTRYNTQVQAGITPTEADIKPVLEYMQKLRDLPEQEGWPEKVEWPEEP